MHCLECPKLGRLPPLPEGTTEQMQGMPVCLIDHARIGDHLARQVCPLGHFGATGTLEAKKNEAVMPWAPRVPLAGDLVAALTARVGLDRAAEFLAHAAGFEDCGCNRHRVWLNRLDARIRRVISR